MANEQVIRDFVCTACGCTCDDLVLTVRDDRIAAFEPPCPLAERFLLAERPTREPGDWTAAVEQAARLLRGAQAPLVMGFQRATVEAQQLAVEIADRLGGFLDATDEAGASQSYAAEQTVGSVAATLGEVAQRSDLIMYWECDPAATHPRHIERFAGRSGQRKIVVDHWPSPSAALADEYMLIPASSGAECLWTLRAIIRGVELDAEHVEAQTGNSVDTWQRLAEQLREAKYAALFYSDAGETKTQTVVELVRDLHRHTRAVALPLGAPWNAVGAAQVLTWQTGFPGAESFARGYPQHLPDEATAARLLARGEVDAALIIAADPLPHLAAAAAAHLRSIPTIVLDDRDTATMAAATVAIHTAAFGLETAGTTFRSDGVALPLRPALTTEWPTAEQVLRQLAGSLGNETPSGALSGAHTPGSES